MGKTKSFGFGSGGKSKMVKISKLKPSKPLA
jgi:hypothetical protein